MSTLIKRNTTVPTRKCETFTTTRNGQNSVHIEVYEGERARTQDNNLLGHFMLQGIPPLPAGIPKIEVTFNIDVNGILHVTAQEKATGRSSKITLVNNSGRLSNEQIERMVADARRFKAQDDAATARIHAKNSLEATAYHLRDEVHLVHGGILETTGEWDQFVQTLNDTIRWLDQHDHATRQEYEEKERHLMMLARPILRHLNNPTPSSSPFFT